jgi:hypothetical protein
MLSRTALPRPVFEPRKRRGAWQRTPARFPRRLAKRGPCPAGLQCVGHESSRWTPASPTSCAQPWGDPIDLAGRRLSRLAKASLQSRTMSGDAQRQFGRLGESAGFRPQFARAGARAPQLPSFVFQASLAGVAPGQRETPAVELEPATTWLRALRSAY